MLTYGGTLEELDLLSERLVQYFQRDSCYESIDGFVVLAYGGPVEGFKSVHANDF